MRTIPRHDHQVAVLAQDSLVAVVWGLQQPGGQLGFGSMGEGEKERETGGPVRPFV